jgi:chlorite dismutase
MTTQVQEATQQRNTTAEGRQVVSFGFYRVDPAWRRLPQGERRRQADDLCSVVSQAAKRLMVPPPAASTASRRVSAEGRGSPPANAAGGGMVLTYSLVGLKADADFLVWSVGRTLEDLQQLAASIRQSAMGGYLASPYAYLSMTKRSTYVDTLDPDHPDKRRFVTPFRSAYLFVYPFVKTHAWYQLPFAERQAMMDEHIVLGNKHPSVRIHTTYAFGLDDPEFVLAFETDEPKDFLDLIMEMRESKARPYTLRDTPIFTCVARSIEKIVEEQGA